MNNSRSKSYLMEHMFVSWAVIHADEFNLNQEVNREYLFSVVFIEWSSTKNYKCLQNIFYFKFYKI